MPLGSALIPPRALQEVDRLRTWWFLRSIRAPTAEFVRRYGRTVQGGPFTGLRYPDEPASAPGDLVAKLLGTYERELHAALSGWVAGGYTHLIDVGCAEGYYAVGLARRVRQASVYAYDIDPYARSRCTALARLNGVEQRVHVRGACEPSSLGEFPEHGVALLSDCEGYERTLLDPTSAPRLRHWPILVELHEFIDPSITETIRSRFADTHDVEIIEGEGRQDDAREELAFTSSRHRAAMLGERRPGPMRWAHLRPR
jgi:hypothetical protein